LKEELKISLGQSASESYFNQDRLFKYVNQFSFPRLAGTSGEEKAVQLTYDTFKEIGFIEDQIIRRSFKFSDFYSTTLMKLVMTLNLIFNLILLLFIYIHVSLTIILLLFMAVVVYLIIKGLKHPETPGFWGEYFGDSITATNVIAKIPASDMPENEAGNLIISAHLDSKSQSINTFLRVILYKIWLYSGLFLGGIYALYLIIIFGKLPISFNITIFGAWISVGLISFSNLFLLFLNTHNKSPGALDNASGMAIVFELSSYFIKHPLKRFNMWFCQFSAEELGTMGSRVFVNDFEQIFAKGRVFQFNFDMISCASHKFNRIEYFRSYGLVIRKKSAPLLSKYLLHAAKNEKIIVKGLHLSTGAHTDTVPFHLRNYNAIDITTGAASLYTHTVKDTPEKVDCNILFNTCRLLRETISMIDIDYKILCENQEIESEMK